MMRANCHKWHPDEGTNVDVCVGCGLQRVKVKNKRLSSPAANSSKSWHYEFLMETNEGTVNCGRRPPVCGGRAP